MAAELQCATCRWWRRINDWIGECRRMPPQPAENMSDPRWWPATHYDDWCGEHARAHRRLSPLDKTE